MAVTTTQTNKPINPRGNDQSPKGYNRAQLFSGKALDFDGVNDYVASDSFSLDTSEWSASMILKNDTAGSDQIFLTFAATGSNDESFILYNNFASSNKISFYGGAFTGSPVVFDYVIPTDYEHLTFTFSSNTLSLYVNGVFVDSGSVTGNDGTQTASAIVGARKQAAYGQYFNGQVSGLKMYSTALTAAQVADLYNNPEKVVPTGVDDSALKLWLPMQEGAGTTAYDGSGNGNHGAVSGASWVHGIGAPVAQTAVIDWNKGTNLTPNSEDWGLWVLNFVSVTTQATTAPDGQTTADKIIVDSNNNFHRIYRQSYPNTTTNDLAFSVYLKYNDHQHVSFGLTDDGKYRAQFVADLVGGTITDEHTDSANVVSSSLTDVGNGWYKLEGVITPTTAWGNNIYTMLMFQNSSTFSSNPFTNAGASVYAWGAQSEIASNNGPYVLTFNSSQDNDVLLPQGLTTGRDITGVNLFENVRKQGALNLDGNSWAEVHDNGSLDFGSGSWTAECWVDWTPTDGKGIMSRWYSSERGILLYTSASIYVRLFTGTVGGAGDYDLMSTSISDGWHHIVGTYDSSDTKLRIYIDGSLNATSGAISNAYNSNVNSLEIGRYNNEPLGTYTNDIAQPRIYNRALTAEEVQRNYNAGKNIYTND